MQNHLIFVLVAIILRADRLLRVGGVGVDECYWECAVEHCDYEADYCNYVCHEVCYPILNRGAAPLLGSARAAARPIVMPGQGIAMSTIDSRDSQLTGGDNQEAARLGKSVKMRLENPAYETLRRGQFVLTRGSPPRGFAMFQACLSGSKMPNDTSANHNENEKEAPMMNERASASQTPIIKAS